MSCPDCKDGFYYPLMGPKEPCQTCLPIAIVGELPKIYKDRDLGEFICGDIRLGMILQINVQSYQPRAVEFQGDKVIEHTDFESEAFKNIIDQRQPGYWWGAKYHIIHPRVGLATFNYRPCPKPKQFDVKMFDFHGPCEVTIKAFAACSYIWASPVMRQL